MARRVGFNMKERIGLLESPRKEIVRFLEKKGWKVLVAGKTGVRLGGLGHNFEYVFEFTGSKKENKK